MKKPQRIIGQVFRYTGDWHPGIRGHLVEIVQVFRGSPDEAQTLKTDEQIGRLLESDIVEFAPLIKNKDGTMRRSWVTSDARASHLENAIHTSG